MAIVAVSVIVVFWNFHNYPSFITDDAIYAYAAESLLESGPSGSRNGPGTGGYIAVPNALAMSVFGERLVSLRYPLFLVLAFLSLAAFHILSRITLIDGLLGGAVMLVLTVPLFPNPSSSWYALSIVVAAALLLETRPQLNAKDFLLLGLLTGCVFFMRQLNGILLGAGVVMVVLPQLQRQQASDNRFMARLLLVTVAVVILFMTTRAQALGSWLMVAFFPTILLLIWFQQLKADNRLVLKFATFYSVGIILASLPLIAFRLSTGTFMVWLESVFVQSVGFSWAEYFPAYYLSIYPLYLMEGLLLRPEWSTFLNASFWLGMLFVPTVLGLACFRLVRAGNSVSIRPVALLALFHAMSILHLQVWMYLFYTAAFCLVGLLALARYQRPTTVWASRFLAIFLLVVGAAFHVGAAFPSTVAHLFWGDRRDEVVNCPIARSGLVMGKNECQRYSKVLNLINDRLDADGTLLTLPNSIEVNFLANRKQALLGHNCAMSLRSSLDLERILSDLERKPPDLVVVNPEDKYFSSLCRLLEQAIIEDYELIATIGEFKIYQHGR